MSSKSFTQIVSDMVTAVQGKATALIDFAIGSVLRSVIEAVASVVVWLESLILVLLQTTRLATSSGSDVDSFVADFGLTRLPAQAATGQVTFARFTSTLQAVIPVGTLVQTGDGTQQFTVIADASQTAYNAALNAYVIAAGASSATATVQAVTVGSGGNVAASTITVIAQALTYVDTVTNALGFTNGANAETDAALRTRFVAYIASLSKATKAAINNAVLSLKTGAACALTENYAYNGTYQPGYFYAVVDDGTGTPNSTFLSSASNAIDAVRPFTSSFGVFAPVVETASVAMTASIAAGYDPVATKAVVQSAVLAYLGMLTLGQSLPYSRLLQVAYDASPGVLNITGLTLNGGTADLAATAQQRILAGTVTVS
ncbi:baseplate J/gp47 family protein [Dyella halodurans]|nr:baseplate J/gp47 family protein [Dyella halodurans]